MLGSVVVPVDRSQPEGREFKNNGGGDLRGRPILVGRAMTLIDVADALFFRAVDRDRPCTMAVRRTQRQNVAVSPGSSQDQNRTPTPNLIWCACSFWPALRNELNALFARTYL